MWLSNCHAASAIFSQAVRHRCNMWRCEFEDLSVVCDKWLGHEELDIPPHVWPSLWIICLFLCHCEKTLYEVDLFLCKRDRCCLWSWRSELKAELPVFDISASRGIMGSWSFSVFVMTNSTVYQLKIHFILMKLFYLAYFTHMHAITVQVFNFQIYTSIFYQKYCRCCTDISYLLQYDIFHIKYIIFIPPTHHLETKVTNAN